MGLTTRERASLYAIGVVRPVCAQAVDDGVPQGLVLVFFGIDALTHGVCLVELGNELREDIGVDVSTWCRGVIHTVDGKGVNAGAQKAMVTRGDH